MKDNNINKVPYTTFEIEQPKKPIKTLEQFQEYKKKQDMKDSETLEEIRNNAKRIKEGQLLIKSTLEKQEPLFIASENVKCCSHFGKQYGILQNVQHRIAT